MVSNEMFGSRKRASPSLTRELQGGDKLFVWPLMECLREAPLVSQIVRLRANARCRHGAKEVHLCGGF